MKKFKYKNGSLSCPVFFPDATRGVIKSLDTEDIKNTKTLGILVNTYHLYTDLNKKTLEYFSGIRKMMNWKGAVISDSGGFQVMSLCKKYNGKVTDKGVFFRLTKKKNILLTPEKSIEFQMTIEPDMVVALDDFTMPKASRKQAKETVDRTVLWAKRSKLKFEQLCGKKRLEQAERPYLLAVVQGGAYADLRKECTERLLEIGFDGYGYGGWPMDENNLFDLKTARLLADIVPKKNLLYGLGIGKPEDIVECVKLGFDIFDCVLPTRDARHGRLYVYKADSIEEIKPLKKDFYDFMMPKKLKYEKDFSPVSKTCDCLLCKNYSRAYLHHLFKVKDVTAGRLASIHNLRFYSMLMERFVV